MGKLSDVRAEKIREIFITILGQEGPRARCEDWRVLGNDPLENEALEFCFKETS